MGQQAQPHVVEIEPAGLIWVKSSASSSSSSSCVEVARTAATILVRDSRDRQGPRLAFPSASWKLLVDQR
ncbi:DUF397 domain-containing protein [Actinocrispum wychmicini]|uniref:Uncharacterized protein DUF397 n=1 Tax=Actinocrispum wychmicini TaxID=1213861 RepID=A0A4R2JQG4_9PSEU|nr:DUF397 domain-containing protein [Actinocrispum wychmicini]TCO62471.1 uncharacterized protein DUF397 [Actinocrispum wychmicini]